MKYLILSLLLVVTDPLQVTKINKIKKEASLAFQEGKYQTAAEQYQFLIDSMEVEDEAVYLNLAHSYYQLNDTAQARQNYQYLTDASAKNVRSIASQQLGVISKNENKLEVALQHFKQSLKANPNNVDARYNYEVVKKLLDKQKENQQNQNNQDQQNENQDQQDQEQNQDQQNQDQQNQDQQDQQNEKQEGEDQNQENKEGEDQESQDEKGKEGEEEGEKESEEQKEGKEGEEEEAKQEDQQQGEEGEEGEKDSDDKSMPPSTSDKLKEMNISEEKAQMILEAMKNNEVQYLQQRQRKATERPDSDKPDW